MTGQKGKKRSFNKSTSITSTAASADIPVKQTPAPQPVAANGATASGDCDVKVAVGATPVPQRLSEKPQSVTSDGGDPAVQTDISKRRAVPSVPATASAANGSQVNGNSNANSTIVPAARTPRTVEAAAESSALPKREAIINKPAAAVKETPPVKPILTGAADAVPAPKPILTAAPTAAPATKSTSFLIRSLTFVLQAYTLPAYYCAGAAIGFCTAVRTELGFKKCGIK